jgi:hypothetical protein
MPKPLRPDSLLKASLIIFTLAFGLYFLSENTADPDLWGHVLFGQRMLELGNVEKAEPFSWSAPGYRWINHEVLAEVALGSAHRLAGGTGLLLLKIGIGLATFLIAMRMAISRISRPFRPLVWGFGAVAVSELAFGFAARPQIFTALGLVLLLALLHRTIAHRPHWGLLIPLLLALWVNTHGGALAGLLLVIASAAAETVALIPSLQKWLRLEARSPRVALVLWLAAGCGAAALCLNPWGPALPKWLIESVGWSRPEIQEWNPAPLGTEHLAFFAMLIISAGALLLTRRRRAAWELAVVGLLGVMALRYVRHTPLFSIAALALVPLHLQDLLQRIQPSTQRLQEAFRRPATQMGVALLLLLGAAGMLLGAVGLHKDHPFTIEIPRTQYPVDAIRFMQAHTLTGNLIVFFDWGEMAIWELPDAPVSLDGRLDTCYPRDVITANWTLFKGSAPDPAHLDLAQAQLALLPPWLAGAQWLIEQQGWTLVYLDDTAALIVKTPADYPQLTPLTLPVTPTANPRTPTRISFPNSRSGSPRAR